MKNEKNEKKWIEWAQKQNSFGKSREVRFIPGTNIGYVTNLKIYQFQLRELGEQKGDEILALQEDEKLRASFKMSEKGYEVVFQFCVEKIEQESQDSPCVIRITVMKMAEVREL